MSMVYFQSLSHFYRGAQRLIPVCFIAAGVALLIGLYGGLVLAPADAQQGDAFRIIYIHVPLAFGSIAAYTLLALCSVVFLIWRVRVAAVLAQAIAPVGAGFTLLALITGAIWGKPMWGAWWIWDARLTAELLLLFIYWGYIGLHQAIPDRTTAHRACAIYALIGFVNIPIIHFSVYWWNTLHQGATVMRFKPAIAMGMYWPLLCMLAAFILYFIAVVCLRAQQRALEEEQDKRWVQSIVKESK